MSESIASDPTVLVADPDGTRRERTVGAVREALPGATVREAESLAAARAALGDPDGSEEPARVDAAVTEYDLGDGTGLELAEYLRTVAPDAGCILYTATTDIDTAPAGEAVPEYVPRTGTDADADQFAAALEAVIVDNSHTAYPLPEDEAGRLAALAAYVDGEAPDRAGDALDRVVDLAATHFGVEVASINLIREDQQDFLTIHGREWVPTPRDASICTYTILEDRTMAVEDTTEDPRFADNDDLREMGIHAYLGANLRTPAGHNIGSLCVYDDQPRSFSAADREYLATLADLVMDILGLAGAEEGENP
jgi:ActR/RegA family two-component response regulator